MFPRLKILSSFTNADELKKKENSFEIGFFLQLTTSVGTPSVFPYPLRQKTHLNRWSLSAFLFLV